jgi:hypothetical protein
VGFAEGFDDIRLDDRSRCAAQGAMLAQVALAVDEMERTYLRLPPRDAFL